MTSLALPRGQGPAFEDLPPTLRPRVVADSAPRADPLRTATYTGAIYLLLTAGAAAVAALGPEVVRLVPRPPGPWRPVILDGTLTPPRPAPPAPVRAGGGLAAPAAPAVPTTQTQEVPVAPAAGLPVEDRSGERPASGSGAGLGQEQAQNQPLGAGEGAGGTRVHDFTMVGLVIRQQVDPVYPAFAKAARIQGAVRLQMVVNESGEPVEVKVLDGHPVFHEAARQAARQWRFEPARMDGRPVMAAFKLTLNFRLR